MWFFLSLKKGHFEQAKQLAAQNGENFTKNYEAVGLSQVREWLQAQANASPFFSKERQAASLIIKNLGDIQPLPVGY